MAWWSKDEEGTDTGREGKEGLGKGRGERKQWRRGDEKDKWEKEEK